MISMFAFCLLLSVALAVQASPLDTRSTSNHQHRAASDVQTPFFVGSVISNNTNGSSITVSSVMTVPETHPSSLNSSTYMLMVNAIDPDSSACNGSFYGGIILQNENDLIDHIPFAIPPGSEPWYMFHEFVIEPNDAINVTLHALSPNSSSISLHNLNSGQNLSHTFTFNSSALCGESLLWGAYNYDDYPPLDTNQVQFRNTSASGGLTAADGVLYSMLSKTNVSATPSVKGGDLNLTFVRDSDS